jgi:hypothetical protein
VYDAVGSGDVDEAGVFVAWCVDFVGDDLAAEPVAVVITIIPKNKLVIVQHRKQGAGAGREKGNSRITKIHNNLHPRIQQLLHILNSIRLAIIITGIRKRIPHRI